MSNIIVLTIQMSGARMFYEFNSFDDFEREYEYLSNNTYLQGAVLKGKLWDDSKRWEKLKEKIKRMRWDNNEFISQGGRYMRVFVVLEDVEEAYVFSVNGWGFDGYFS